MSEADFDELSNKIWGEGNWVICEECLDGNDMPSRHHRNFHNKGTIGERGRTDEAVGDSSLPVYDPNPSRQAIHVEVRGNDEPRLQNLSTQHAVATE